MKNLITVLATLSYACGVLATSCPDLTGSYVCPLASTGGVAMTINITQIESANEKMTYRYEYVYATAPAAVVEYVAYPVGSPFTSTTHLYCSNEILFCDGSTTTATNFYLVDPKTDKYVVGHVGQNPIVCDRIP